MRLLLVEDEPVLLWELKLALEGAGYTVSLATSAEQGLRILEYTEVDLICADIRTPGSIDGIALARAAKISHPELPVILISAEVESRDVGDVADGYFSKPVALTRLLKRIDQLRQSRTLSTEDD